jgi:bacterioferritin
MQGSPIIIEFLNEALTAELTAINQYFAHHKLCENWGWKRLAAKYREESIEEMQDAEKLIDRIILLDGMPNLQRMGSVRVGETVPEQFEVDRQLEMDAIERYRRGVVLAVEEGDPGTREMLEQLVVGEEQHLDWIDTQLSMVEDIGIERYLLAQIGEDR